MLEPCSLLDVLRVGSTVEEHQRTESETELLLMSELRDAMQALERLCADGPT